MYSFLIQPYAKHAGNK